jgi:hypothetical protein
MNTKIYDAVTRAAPSLGKASRRKIVAEVESALPGEAQAAVLSTEVDRLRTVIVWQAMARPRQAARRLGIDLDLDLWQRLCFRAEEGDMSALPEMAAMLFPENPGDPT